MGAFDWHDLLQRWSTTVFESGYDPSDLPHELIAARWLGYPGATEDQLTRLEERLGTALPPSYRAFLKVSNGWHLADGVTDKLWSTEEVEWFAVRHQDWVDTWMKGADEAAPMSDEEYFDYTRGDGRMRPQYLQSSLEISTIYPDNASIYLLNPEIVSAEGEWEVWFLASWIPGAHRTPSFQQMMEDAYGSILDLIEQGEYGDDEYEDDEEA